jgi:hypothetical protein
LGRFISDAIDGCVEEEEWGLEKWMYGEMDVQIENEDGNEMLPDARPKHHSTSLRALEFISEPNVGGIGINHINAEVIEGVGSLLVYVALYR